MILQVVQSADRSFEIQHSLLSFGGLVACSQIQIQLLQLQSVSKIQMQMQPLYKIKNTKQPIIMWGYQKWLRAQHKSSQIQTQQAQLQILLKKNTNTGTNTNTKQPLMMCWTQKWLRA